MPSDPTTRDLIEAAREAAAIRYGDSKRLLGALADRLEEVEEERDGLWEQLGKVRRPLSEASKALHEIQMQSYTRTLKPPGGDADDTGAEHEQPADSDVTQGESGTPVQCPAAATFDGSDWWHCLLREGHDGWHEASGSSWGREVRIRFNDHSPDTDSPEPSDPDSTQGEPFPDDEDMAAIVGGDPEPEDWFCDTCGFLASQHPVGTICDCPIRVRAAPDPEPEKPPAQSTTEPDYPDPDTDDVPNRAESVDPEPEDETTLEEMLEQAAREKGEDWPPDPDPWYRIERIAEAPAWRPGPEFAPTVARALLDLRERVGRQERLEPSTLRLLSDYNDRLTTLEQHADRGSKVEGELRERVDVCLGALDRFLAWERGALKRRAEGRDTEALAERVERMEQGETE